MTVARAAARPAAFVAFVLIACLASSCGPGARDRTIRATVVALAASSDAISAYDKATQDDIVLHATSETDGIAKLTAYKARRDAVLLKLGVALHLLSVAAVLDDKPASLVAAVAAVTAAQQAWEELRRSP